MELGRSGGVQGDRTDRTKTAPQIFARFGLTWHRQVHFSIFSGELTFQCSSNGPQNPQFCPGSLQDTFIIYSSISHQHIFQKCLAKRKISKIENLEISKVDPGKLVDSFSPRDGPVCGSKYTKKCGRIVRSISIRFRKKWLKDTFETSYGSISGRKRIN